MSTENIENKGKEAAESGQVEREVMWLLVAKLEEYIKLLQDELYDVVGIAACHGWRSTRSEQGQRLREEITKLKEAT